MSKTIQIRMSDQEHALVKTAFADENMSKFVRDFLLQEADKRLQNMDMSVQTDDKAVRGFVEILSNQEVQLMLYKIFKSAKEG